MNSNSARWNKMKKKILDVMFHSAYRPDAVVVHHEKKRVPSSNSLLMNFKSLLA